jgi:hypothetical protein
MMGSKTLKEIKEEIKKGRSHEYKDSEGWIEERLFLLEKEQAKTQLEIELLRVLQNLIGEVAGPATKRKKGRSKPRTKRLRKA